MKKFNLLMLAAVLMGLVLLQLYLAHRTITPEQAAKFIGQQRTVCGTVANVRFEAESQGQPTFINFDKSYPNQFFTVLIWGADRSNFNKPPETLYAGKEICATGRIQSDQDRLEIIVKEPSQISLK